MHPVENGSRRSQRRRGRNPDQPASTQLAAQTHDCEAVSQVAEPQVQKGTGPVQMSQSGVGFGQVHLPPVQRARGPNGQSHGQGSPSEPSVHLPASPPELLEEEEEEEEDEDEDEDEEEDEDEDEDEEDEELPPDEELLDDEPPELPLLLPPLDEDEPPRSGATEPPHATSSDTTSDARRLLRSGMDGFTRVSLSTGRTRRNPDNFREKELGTVCRRGTTRGRHVVAHALEQRCVQVGQRLGKRGPPISLYPSYIGRSP